MDPAFGTRTSATVSVLVPAYNSRAYIAECLQSVLAQTYEAMAITVVDDCSTDGTYDVAREVTARDARVTVLRNDTNLGNRGNFERCLSLASAPFVKFVCGDDALEPQALARMVALAEDRPDVALVTSRRHMVDERGAVLTQPAFPTTVGNADMEIDGIAAGDILLTSGYNWIGEPTTVLFRRQLLDLDRLYRIGSAAPQRNLDIVWWLKIMAGHRMGAIAEPLSRFRIHAGQQSRQAHLRTDLVMSWYDIITGASEIGYLQSPEAESTALAAFVRTVQANVANFEPSEFARTAATLSAVETRLLQLAAA